MPENSLSYLLDRLSHRLIANKQMLAVAESCTGGGIAKAMTSLPGSSQWFERGFVTYSNTAKRELLGVHTETLELYGAVSEQTVAEMAEGVLVNSHAQFSVAVTGIAGPDGGTDQKPVGTVCFGWSHGDNITVTTTNIFKGNREAVREQAILMAIQGLLDYITSLNL